MEKTIRYMTLWLLLMTSLVAAAQQNRTLTCKTMPDALREAIITQGRSVSTVAVYEAQADGKHGNIIGGFTISGNEQLTLPAGKQVILSFGLDGSWSLEKWYANGQLLGGSEVEYTGTNKFGYYDDFYFEVPFTMPDNDVELEVWMSWTPPLPGDPGDGTHSMRVVSNAGQNMTFSFGYPLTTNSSNIKGWQDGDTYYAPTGEVVGISVTCADGWRPRRLEMDGAVIYEGDGMYGEMYEGQKIFSYYYVMPMPNHDVTIYAYGEFSPDTPDKEGDDLLPNMPGSNGWDATIQEATITNITTYTDTYNHNSTSLADALLALTEREHFTCPDIKSLVIACDLKPKGYNSAESQLQWLFTTTLPTDNLERIDLSRSWNWGTTEKSVYNPQQGYVPITFQDGTPVSDGVVGELFGGAYNSKSTASLRHLLLPACITGFVGEEVFKYCTTLQSLTLFSATPPKVDPTTLNPLSTSMILYVPVESMAAYQADPYWRRFLDIRPIDDTQVTDLTVYLPADYNDGRYAGMSLIVRHADSGETMKYVIDDRSDYTFRTLPRGVRYTVSLVTSRDVVLATNDDVYTYQRYVQAAFSNITPLHDLTLVVRADGQDITDRCELSWTTADGTPIGDSATLRWQPHGTTVGYDITLPINIAYTFVQPAHTHVVVGNVPDRITVNAQRPALTTISGRVIDDNGDNVNGAHVVFAQPLNNDVSRTYATVTDGNGNFTLEAVQGHGVLSVSDAGYINYSSETTLPLADDVSIILRKITGPVVRYDMPFTQSALEDASQQVIPAYTDMDNVDITVFNITTGQTLDNVAVQYPQIILVDGAKAGDQLSLTASSRKNAFLPVQATTTLDADGNGSATLPVTELGGLRLSMLSTDNAAVTVNIYDASGELYDTYAMSNADYTVDGMPDGNYTIVMMTTTEMLGRITRLSQYAELGLRENTDFVRQNAAVTSGRIKAVTFATVPVLDVTRFYYIDVENSTFTANKSEVSVGSNFSLKCSVTLKPEYVGRVTAAQLVVELPSAAAAVTGSAMTGQRVVQFTNQNGRITIPIAVNDLGQNTRFAATAVAEGEIRPSAWLNLTIDGQQVKQPLATAYIKSNGLELNVPEVICEKRATIWGYAPSLSQVTVIANDMEIGHTMAGADGMWSIDCQLPEAIPNLARIAVNAHIRTKEGTTFETETREMTYDVNAIVVEHVFVYTSPNCIVDYRNRFDSEFVDCVDFDYQHPEKRRPIFSPGFYGNYVFTFYVQFNTADSSKIDNVDLILKMENGTYFKFPCYYNGERGQWMQQIGGIGLHGMCPVNIAIDFNTKNIPYKVDSRLIDSSAGLLNNMQAALRETMELAESYIDRISTETNQERLNELLSEFNATFNIDPYMELDPEWRNLTDAQFVAKVQEFVDNNSPDIEGFLNASIYEQSVEGITIGHATNISEADLIAQGYDLIPTTEYGSIYLLATETHLYIVDFRNDLSLDYDLTKVPSPAGMIQFGPNKMSLEELQEKISNMTSNFQKFQWLIELAQNACKAVIEGMKVAENIKMCDNAIAIYEAAKRSGKMVAEAEKNIARMAGAKAFWEGLKNWMDELAKEGPNISTAMAAFTKGEGIVAKSMKVLQGCAKCVEKFMSWATLISDITEGVTKLKKLMDVYHSVPDPCKDDFYNASRIRDNILGYSGGVALLYSAVVVSDLASMFQVNGGLTGAAASGGASLAGTVTGIGLLIAKSVGMDMFGKDYQQRIRNWDQEIYLLECDRKKPDFDPEHPYWKRRIMELRRFNDQQVIRDPSGYVYEAVTDNRVEGATATIFYEGDVEDIYGDTHKDAIKWNAEDFGQRNPQMTDGEGRYNWDVPEGLWQVKIEKDGYETATSDWLPVPPPQLDVNIGIRQLAQPTVKKAIAYEDGVELEFSKYMRPGTLTDYRLWLSNASGKIASTIVHLNKSRGLESNDEFVSRVMMQTAAPLKAGDKVVLTVRRDVESYAGVPMAADYQQEFVVTSRVRQMAADSLIEVPVGGERIMRVVAYPASAAKGKQVNAVLQHDFMAATEGHATFNDQGVALLTLQGLTGGTTSLNLSMSDDEKVKTSALVQILDPDAMPVAAPMASRISGTGVNKGDLLELWCDTEGATIWYTTDGTCPCDENGTRKQYTAPIVLNPPVTIRAYAVKGNQPDSRIVSFHYDVYSGIISTKNDEPHIVAYYDMEGRRIAYPKRGLGIVRMSDGTTRKVIKK